MTRYCRKSRWILSSIAILATWIAPTIANSADKPWTAKKFPQSELIDFGTFQRSPLELPWTVQEKKQVTSHGNVNFEHVLQASYSDVREEFEKAYNAGKPALKLKSFASPPGAPRELYVTGMSTQNDIRRFTLGNANTRRSFVVELEKRQGRTVLTFQNMTYSMLFSAGVPLPKPFRPADAEPVSVTD